MKNQNVHARTSFHFFEDFYENILLSYLRNTIEFNFGEQVGGAYSMKIEQAISVNSGLKLDLISLSQDSNFKILVCS